MKVDANSSSIPSAQSKVALVLGIVDDAFNIFPCDGDYADEACQLAIYLQLRWSAESATGKPLVDGSGGFTEVAPDLYYAYYKHNPEVVSDGPGKVYFVLDSSQQKNACFHDLPW